ncbi:MAG: hypothetical protein K6E56_02965 [Lachnospiraceae bacterium]|nr:hypothetical protein [Lachnospiraceae bacterium]
MENENRLLKERLELAKNYIKTIDYVDITEAFEEPDYDKWKDGLNFAICLCIA